MRVSVCVCVCVCARACGECVPACQCVTCVRVHVRTYVRACQCRVCVCVWCNFALILRTCGEAGRVAQWLGVGLIIKRSQVRVPAGAVGESSLSTPTPSMVNVCAADSYFGFSSTPVLPQQHVNDPGHSAKSADGRLQLNTYALYVCSFARSDTVNWCMVV